LEPLFTKRHPFGGIHALNTQESVCISIFISSKDLLSMVRALDCPTYISAACTLSDTVASMRGN